VSLSHSGGAGRQFLQDPWLKFSRTMGRVQGSSQCLCLADKRLKVQGQCLYLVDPGFKVHDNVYLMTLSHQGLRGRLLTYACILPYTVLRYCKVVVGFRDRVGYLCVVRVVYRYEYVVKTITKCMWCGYWSCKVTWEVI
jgi:hypothetical protein